MSTEIAGLPVRSEPAGLMTPLAAVAVIKGLDSDGNARYWTVTASDITDVEAIGMHTAALRIIERRLPG